MKKLLAAMMIAVFALTLSACGDNGEVPDDIVDCIQNPDDPECQQAIDCLQNPDDPECEVDCTVTPDDPSCEVDCTVTPDDPACDVDCTVTPDDPACDVDCTVTPDDPSCQLQCPSGYENIDGSCVVIDTRTPAEVAADLIIENWDGTMEHVDMLMEHMNFNDAMTMIVEYNVEVLDGEGTPHVLNLTVQDEIDYGEYDVIQRTITGEIEEEEFEFILVIEETETGFIVYYDTTFLRAMLVEEDLSGEVQDVLDTLDANGTWFMFKFDDSLENLVELEVLKEMVVAAIYQELGDDIFAVIEDEINMALGLDLATYGFMFEDFVGYIIDEDFAAAELMLDNVNYDLLIYDLDQIHLVPEIINHLTMYQAEMLLVDPTWDLAVETQFLLDNGTEAWLNQLTEQEIQNILTVHDPLLGEAYGAYLADDLDHWIIMQFLNDPQVQLDLAEIPGLDVVAFTNTMDVLDYDAFYLEDVDMEALFQAVYDGYAAYDAFVGGLNVTAPQTASILAHFGGVDGLVAYLQEYMVIVDDINLGFENLVMFEEYVTPEYYLDIELYEVMLEATEDFELLGTAVVDTSASSQLFQDFMNDLYWYIDAFESFDLPYVDVFNCPELAECDTFSEYPEIVDFLDQMGDIVITVQYDPLNLDEVVYQIQFSDFVQELIGELDPENLSVVNDFSITVTMLTNADPVVPTEDITDVNQAAEDFARFSLVMEAHNYLRNIQEYYMMFPGEIPLVPTNTPVVDIGNYIGVSVAFDEDLSYFRIDGAEITIQLYWLDGTPVFTEPLSMTELDVQFAAGTGAPSRAEFLYWMEKVVPENFNMTKLFLVYMWERSEDYYYMPL